VPLKKCLLFAAAICLMRDKHQELEPPAEHSFHHGSSMESWEMLENGG